MAISRDVVPMVKQERAQATVALLLEATVDALQQHGESGVRLEDILDATGVSRSSLYHHFGDRDGLIDAARLLVFSRGVDADLRALELALERSSSAAEFRASVRAMLADSQSPDRQSARLQRAYTIGAAAARPALAAALAKEQRRLTERYQTFTLLGQAKGWVRRDLDASVLAVFVQAFTHGRVVSDIDAKPVDADAWTAFITHMIEQVILVDD